MSIRYYQEPTGDYLAIETAQEFRRDTYEGRATAIEGNISSVCTCGVGKQFLKECKSILKQDVPDEWIKAMWPGA